MTQQMPQQGSKRRTGCSRETRRLIDALTAAGADVRPTNNCHYKVYFHGTLVTILAGTPSEYRGLKNDITSKGTYQP
jgi:hypothetical protein